MIVSTLIALFVANALAHVVSYRKLKQSQAPNSTGVLAFVFINAIIALIIWQGFDWAPWFALAFPAIGGLALLFTTILKGKATWIDYVILILDITTVGLVLKYLIL